MNKLVKVVAGVFSLIFGFCYAGGVDKPLSLLVERASLMQEVGVCKHKFNSPIYDAAQEIRVLQNAQNLAKENHLEMSTFLTFIQLQMDLSKQIEDFYWRNATEQELKQQSSDCLANYRDKVKKVDEQLYPAISKNIKAIRKDKKLILKLSELVKKQNIQGIPQDPSYLVLLANSLQNIKKAK
ncbi:chorismate mutase [Francisella tularensis]|uniref:chorismate mutase n=1 Tax=Francisella tularensis TaxID=263 RepID=UPI0000F593CB|nr:chorismate mutase [Francisella tularensis]ABO47609.1 putative chorismate mutase [Francisella tularensis subsp. tularensis WY96-3418]AKH92778.1 chorismate mutase [Francisella tularensis subsp. tularensis WY-00W4114]AKU72771.1 chorismate mutase type II family protein [Francisella tularensis subsp. tularensis]EKM84530.1 chorismate mutase [Francisella tularensis subsp. tularensis 831]EKM84628.1 chorismate mutase [Francisella tularensis subsp. tularensis AS_713]